MMTHGACGWDMPSLHDTWCLRMGQWTGNTRELNEAGVVH